VITRRMSLYRTSMMSNPRPRVSQARSLDFGSTSRFMSDTKAEEGAFQCKFCNRTFGVQRSLRRHENVHKGTLHYCDICSKGFTDPWILKRHHQVHNKNGSVKAEMKFDCPQCHITYLNRKDFENHICSAAVQQQNDPRSRIKKMFSSTHPSRSMSQPPSSHDSNQFIEISKLSPLQRFPTRSVIQPARAPVITANSAGPGRGARKDFVDIPDWRVGFSLSYTCQRCGEQFHQSEEWQTIIITHLCPF